MIRPLLALAVLLALAEAASLRKPLAAGRFEEQLLSQKRAISNWEEFKQGNNVSGWDDDWQRPDAVDVCEWTGVTCSEYDSTIFSLNLACSYDAAPLCKVRAQGTLAPELGNITSLVELSLNGQSLSGSLPASWGQQGAFSALKTLSLYKNKLKGSLPPSWGSKGAWPELQKLDINRNQLTGTLPEAWGGGFPKLEQLVLDENAELGGSLPASWAGPAAFPALTKLSIQLANVSGTLPAAWAASNAFGKLEDVVLAFNLLTGNLPPGWGNATAWPALKSLSLAVNGLNGTLPPAWGNRGGFKQLELLGLDSNLLSGSIPPEWALNNSFPQIQGLNLDNNTQLCGKVPNYLFAATCVAVPPRGTSCVNDELPSCTGNLSNATTADVEKLLAQKAAITNWDEFSRLNNVTGWDSATPVCQWTGITCSEGDSGAILKLELYCNFSPADYAGEVPLAFQDPPFAMEGQVTCPVKAQGTLAPELASISTLESILLYNQNFSGNLPSAWGGPSAFPKLTEIDLTLNSLTGPFPESWGTLGAFRALKTLFLDRNNLSGTLPAGWWVARNSPRAPLVALENVYFGNNALSGTLPAEWADFKNLKYLDLGNNSLSGTLPDYWGRDGSFPQLSELLLNNQKDLRGPLPPTWGTNGSFPQLWQINVNNNNLTGTLPESWAQGNASFPMLGAMEINNNKLTGPLPASWATNQSFAQLSVLELRNNQLTGAFPPSWNTSDTFVSMTTLAVSGNSQLCGRVPTRLQTAVCGADLKPKQTCTNGAIKCPPRPPPSPPSPPPPPALPIEPSSDGGGSLSAGAIAGIAVGCAVVLALLAFFALRPRKGWLRRRGAGKPEPMLGDAPAYSGSGGSCGSPYEKPDDEEAAVSKLVPPVDPNALSLLPASVDTAPDSSLPFSYVTTGASWEDRGTAGGTSAATPPTVRTPQTVSAHSLESDPVLTIISTRLATLRQQRSDATSLGRVLSDRTASDASSELPEEVRQWAVTWDSIQLERLIGKGSYGRVYLATRHATPVAVKVLINPDGSEPSQDLELPADITKQLQEEAVVMSRMRHPNVVGFMGLCTLPPCILTEYCSRGSLYDVLRQAQRDPDCAAELTWQRRLSMAFDAARGLLNLQLRNIIHRDVKSPNLLIDSNWNVKVCDFNLSEIMRPNMQAAQGAINPIWLAPEVLSGQRATAASDVYSYGLVMYELLTWQLPWRNVQLYQIRRSVLEGKRPEVPPPEQLPGPDNDSFTRLAEYMQLMSDCWAQNPRKRPTFGDVVARLQLLMGLPSSSALLEQSGRNS